MKTRNLFIVIVTALIFSSILLFGKKQNSTEQAITEKEDDLNYTVPVTIEDGKTFSILMEEKAVTPNATHAILSATQDIYDLSSIKAGKNIFFTYEKNTGQLLQLMYPINDEEELFITKDISTSSPDVWLAERKKINYEIRFKTFQGTIQSSLYEDGLKLQIPQGTIIEFADIFEYAVDYAYDIRVGDTFQFVVEEKFRDGTFAMLGRILAGQFVNNDKTYFAYYFIEDESNKGYFDEKGNSVQKMFLRAPLAFKYISSGFTTGRRYVAAFNVSTGHRAIDYAASSGTPIRAVGDGTVTLAGWSAAGYGFLTSIRHNSTYSTNYAHQSKIIVKRGQRVKQGQVIGYVGSTGFSTGPHLHYEMVKNGVKINPLREIFPPGKPLQEENKQHFSQIMETFNTIFGQ